MLRNELLEYFKAERKRGEKTRDIQWKFNIAFWGLLALGVHFFDSKNIGNCKCLIYICMGLFFVAHFLFVFLSQRGIAASRKLSDQMLDAMDKSNDKEFVYFSLRRIKGAPIGKYGWLWVLFQVLGTIILLIIFLIKINAPIP